MQLRLSLLSADVSLMLFAAEYTDLFSSSGNLFHIAFLFYKEMEREGQV